MRKITRIFMLLMAMSLLTAVPTFASSKGGYKYVAKNEYIIAEPNNGACDDVFLSTDTSDAKLEIISIKSSNKKVVDAVIDKVNNCGMAQVKKPGTATLTSKFKVNGKKYTCKTKYHVRKYENPFSSFKINGKEYKNIFNKDWFLTKNLKLKNKNLKISYKLKKGWKVYRSDMWTDKSKVKTFEDDGEKYFASKKVKSGKTYKAKKWANGEIELSHGKYDGTWAFEINPNAKRKYWLGYSDAISELAK